MTANVDPIFLLVPKRVAVTIAAADTTVKKAAFTAGAEGGAVVTLQATSFDASDAIVVLSVNNGTSSFQIGEITVPAGSGTNGTLPPVNLLDPELLFVLDEDDSYIMQATDVFEVAAKVTVGGDVDITGIAGNY